MAPDDEIDPGRPDPAWLISALVTAAFLIGAATSHGAMALGWFVLAVGMGGVTVLRYRASHPPSD